MNIWTFIETNSLPEHGHFNRHYNLAKSLVKLGHNPTVFVGSHPHNSNIQLINTNEKYVIYQNEPFFWVIVKTLKYENSKIKRILSMFLFNINAEIAAKKIYKTNKPDCIIASSPQPVELLLAIKLGKKYKCKTYLEIRDLWPESIIAFGYIKRKGIIAKVLKRIEKELYIKADGVIFTMPGGKEYIKDQGWNKEIPENKVFYLNNGINNKEYLQSIQNHQIKDEDLDDKSTFKVIYTGSLRRANNIDLLIESAKLLNNERIKILIWGTGPYYDELNQKILDNNIENCKLKGKIDKKYIPYILSKGNLNILNYDKNAGEYIFKYGSSQNKLFEYLASGKPILSNTKIGYDLISSNNCGTSKNINTDTEYAKEITNYENMNKEKYEKICKNCKETAKKFDFDILANSLINDIINK